MKNFTFGLVALIVLSCLPAQAQITVPASTFPAAGDTLRYVEAANPGIAVALFTPPGSNQSWDLSALTPASTFEVRYRPAAEGVFVNNFTGAAMVAKSGTDEYYYVSTSSPSKFQLLGQASTTVGGLPLIAIYKNQPALSERHAPLNFFDLYAQSSNNILSWKYSDIPAGAFTLPAVPDSVRIRISKQVLEAVDAWGGLRLPGAPADFSVLRLKKTTYHEQRIDAKIPPLGWLDVTDNVLQSGGAWAPLFGVDTFVTHHYFNDVSKEEIAVLTFNTAQNAVIKVVYKNAPSVCAIPNAGTISGTTTVCPGATTQLSSNGAAGGTWSSSNTAAATVNASGLVSGVAPGMTTIRYTVTSGSCTSSAAAVVTVNTAAACIPGFSGIIFWEHNDFSGVKNATVDLSGAAAGSTTTDSSGFFNINPGPINGNYTLKPVKNINKYNGVTVADVNAIKLHAAGTVLIADNYKKVCADINASNSITATDATILNQALLANPNADLKFSTSWRFVPTDHVMANPPWGFPEARTYTGISGNQINQNFFGMKIGDVVSSYANPANFGEDQPLLALTLPDKTLEAGTEFDANFLADQCNDLAAFQLALRFDPALLQLLEAQPAAGLPLKADDFGLYNAGAGEVRVVWSQPEGFAVEEAAPAFRLRFKALKGGGRLSEVLKMDGAELPALAYDVALSESPVSLKFSQLSATGDPLDSRAPQLFQNRPNPFQNSTRIAFTLPEAGEAQLRIFDATSRLLQERKAVYPAGRHEELFDLSHSAGVLWYELKTPYGVLTRKMIQVK